MRKIIVLLFLIGSFSGFVLAQSATQIEKDIQNYQAQIGFQTQQLNVFEEEVNTYNAMIQNEENQIAALNSELPSIENLENAQVNSINAVVP